MGRKYLISKKNKARIFRLLKFSIEMVNSYDGEDPDLVQCKHCFSIFSTNILPKLWHKDEYILCELCELPLIESNYVSSTGTIFDGCPVSTFKNRDI